MKTPTSRLYENPGELQRMRSVVMAKAKDVCEKCGKPVYLVHHRDGKKKDHSEGNLLALCSLCHGAIHSEMRWFALSGLFFPNSLLADTPKKILNRLRTEDMRRAAKVFQYRRAFLGKAKATA